MRRCLLAVWMIVGFGSAHAQWEGSLRTEGGWNFQQSNSELIDFNLKCSGKNNRFGAGLTLGHKYLPSSQTTSILDAKKKENEFYKGERKTENPRRFNAGVHVDYGHTFDTDNLLELSLAYKFNGMEGTTLLETERYNADRTVLDGLQRDTSYARNHRLDARIAFRHTFPNRKGASLDVELTGTFDFNMEANRRITSGNFYARPKQSATYSSLNGYDNRLSASYSDLFRFETGLLKLKAGADVIISLNLDGYAAETYVNGHWRDSVQYRQSYYYHALSTEPYLHLTYSLGKFDFQVMERVQFYRHAVTNELEKQLSAEQMQMLFDKTDFENLLGAGIVYNVSDRHRLALDYGRIIVRPEYKKLCPTLSIGKSEGEYFMGNAELEPEITDKVNLGYTYTNGIFVTRFDLNFRDRRNTVEKVIDIEKSKDVKDPMVRTLYTWLNNKRQVSYGSRLNLRINAAEVKADIWAGFNYDIYEKAGRLDKEDFNYELGSSVEVFLNETTRLSSSLAYISARQSAYNFKGEDVVANLRLSKRLVKRLELYVEFRDIADKDVYEETWNADMTYLKVVTTKPMNRAALLGINYIF